MTMTDSLFPSGRLLVATSRTGSLYGYADTTTSNLSIQFIVPSTYTPPSRGEEVFWRPSAGSFSGAQWKSFVAGFKSAGGVYELYRSVTEKVIPNVVKGTSFKDHFTVPVKGAPENSGEISTLQFNDGMIKISNMAGTIIGGCVAGTYPDANGSYHGEIWQLNAADNSPSESSFFARWADSSIAGGLSELDNAVVNTSTSDPKNTLRLAILYTREFMGLP